MIGKGDLVRKAMPGAQVGHCELTVGSFGWREKWPLLKTD